jgi:hypothetical protein
MRRDPPSPASARQKPELERLYDEHAQLLYAFSLNLTCGQGCPRSAKRAQPFLLANASPHISV